MVLVRPRASLARRVEWTRAFGIPRVEPHPSTTTARRAGGVREANRSGCLRLGPGFDVVSDARERHEARPSPRVDARARRQGAPRVGRGRRRGASSRGRRRPRRRRRGGALPLPRRQRRSRRVRAWMQGRQAVRLRVRSRPPPGFAQTQGPVAQRHRRPGPRDVRRGPRRARSPPPRPSRGPRESGQHLLRQRRPAVPLRRPLLSRARLRPRPRVGRPGTETETERLRLRLRPGPRLPRRPRPSRVLARRFASRVIRVDARRSSPRRRPRRLRRLPRPRDRHPTRRPGVS